MRPYSFRACAIGSRDINESSATSVVIPRKPVATATKSQEPETTSIITTQATEKGNVSNKDLLDDWETSFRNLSIVAALGSSITFVLIPSQLQDPTDVSVSKYIDLKQVRILLSSPWLSFAYVILSCSVSADTLKKQLRASPTPDLGSLHFSVGMAYFMLLSAIMCISAVIAAYSERIGIVCLACLGPYSSWGFWMHLCRAIRAARKKSGLLFQT